MRGAQYLRLLIELGPSLFKWHAMSLVEFDALLFTDLDVDVMPARHWSDRALAIREDWMRVYFLFSPNAN